MVFFKTLNTIIILFVLYNHNNCQGINGERKCVRSFGQAINNNVCYSITCLIITYY